MSKQYETLGREIVDLVGGKDNVSSLHHCQTRLRFQLVDNEKADKEAIVKLDGVVQALVNGGMFQVVIGMHVAEVYEEVIKFLDVKEIETGASESIGEKQKLFDVITEFISSIFSPIVPALAGAGMVKALLALLVAFKWIDNTSQTYIVLNMIGDSTFSFMPILLAYTTAQKLKCNPILAAVTAGILVHPVWGTLVDAGDPVQIFGLLPLYLVKYTNSVIPIVLVILIQSFLEKRLNRIIPSSVRLVFVPMITFLIIGVLSLFAIAPLGDYVGHIFTGVFSWLSNNVSWLETSLMGGFYSILVIFGLHHGLAPLGTMQMAQMGFDSIFGPGVLCANIGQGTASFVIGLLSKDEKEKQIATSSGITGLMGVTEPALYGINVPKKYPLIAGAIGAAIGGLFAGLTHTRRFATGSSGLPAVMMYIGDNTTRFLINISISLIITVTITAILTVIFYKRFEKDSLTIGTIENSISHFKETDQVAAPISGEAFPITESDDPVFASKSIGEGAIILPSSTTVVSPFDGEVITVFPTKHAIGLISKKGCEVLIHVGINTVELNGKGFESFVRQGDKVTKGQKLLTFNKEAIEDSGHSSQVIIAVTNSAAYQTVDVFDNNYIESGSKLIQVS
ncbi:beta-glucoside-specific PTS transporter subunit IIABC [Streptococcus merionis]|uniref:beta-glucoside-specific PTS transporter subunit IIABC n=1 Tax=Streptococcus merionis TaxID=400065 RepID=UPI0035190138